MKAGKVSPGMQIGDEAKGKLGTRVVPVAACLQSYKTSHNDARETEHIALLVSFNSKHLGGLLSGDKAGGRQNNTMASSLCITCTSNLNLLKRSPGANEAVLGEK